MANARGDVRPQRRIRLLWLIDSFNMGGAESLVVPFIRGHDASRYELFVVCLASIGGNVVEQEVRRENVPFENLGAKNLRDVRAFRRLLRFVREHEIDLIHAHLTYANTWAALVSRITGVPSIASLHVAPPAAGKGAIARDWLMRVALDRWSSTVIAVSGALREQYLKLRSVDPAKYRAVHNGIELARFDGDRATSREFLSREFGIPPLARVAVTVSVLREGKGVETLLAAADKIVQQVPDAYLLIAGDGAKRDEWTALSRTLGVAADRVRWLGYRRDVHAILPGCDLLVHPSLDDAFPTVLLEAMAAGLPVVASRVGGIPEIVVEGVTGALVPPGDPQRLTEEVVRLLGDRDTTARMSAAARDLAREKFSTAAWIARLDEVYASVGEVATASPRLRQPTQPAVPAKVVVIEFAGKGGMIHYVFQLCRAMAQAGADVTLITEKNYELAALEHPFKVETLIDLWDPKPAGQLSTNRIAVLFRKLRRITRAFSYYAEWLRVIRRVNELKPDVVQLGDIRFPSDLFPLMLLRRKARLFADICHNVHPFSAGGKSGGLFDRSASRRFFYRRIYRLFDRVFVHFERNREEFTSTFGVPAKKVSVIVHGNEELFDELRDPAVDPAELRRRIGVSAEERIVLFFGTLSRYKGTDVLLEAFPRIHGETGARLVLAGYPFHDFDVEAHRELTRRLGIADSVTWVPEYIASEHIAAWMRLASVIVFPYRDIYQSGALHVAQTFGAPIVASRVGAMQDVIEHEVSGLLVPTEDANALGDAIIRLLRDEPLARRLGARAAEDAQGPFSWRENARKVLAAYGA